MSYPSLNQERIIYIKFGPGETEEVPADWASTMLTLLKQKNPKLFGDLLVEAIGAVKSPKEMAQNGHSQWQPS